MYDEEDDLIRIFVLGMELGEEDVVWGMIVFFECIGGGGKFGKAAYGVDVLVRTRENSDGKILLLLKSKNDRYEFLNVNEEDDLLELWVI